MCDDTCRHWTHRIVSAAHTHTHSMAYVSICGRNFISDMIIMRHVIRMFMRCIYASHSGGNKLISILHNWIKRTNDKLVGDKLAKKLSHSVSPLPHQQKTQTIFIFLLFFFGFLLYFCICSLGWVHFFRFFCFQCVPKTIWWKERSRADRSRESKNKKKRTRRKI